MPKKIVSKLFFFVFAILLTFGLSISLQSLLAAWTSPTAAPPNNNTDAPVNVGAATQTKSGTLNLGGNINVIGLMKGSSGLDVGNAAGAYSYITLRDDESVNGVKYIHANSDAIGFLSGTGLWLTYWDAAGNQQNFGQINSIGGGAYRTGGVRVGYQTLNSNADGWLYLGNIDGSIFGGQGIAMDNLWANNQICLGGNCRTSWPGGINGVTISDGGCYSQYGSCNNTCGAGYFVKSVTTGEPCGSGHNESWVVCCSLQAINY
jgi:hypothetical protein